MFQRSVLGAVKTPAGEEPQRAKVGATVVVAAVYRIPISARFFFRVFAGVLSPLLRLRWWPQWPPPLSGLRASAGEATNRHARWTPWTGPRFGSLSPVQPPLLFGDRLGLVGWLVGWLTLWGDWLVGWLANLIRQLTGGLIDRSIRRLIGGLVGCFIGMVDLVVGRYQIELTEMLDWLTGWLADWFVDWLVDLIGVLDWLVGWVGWIGMLVWFGCFTSIIDWLVHWPVTRLLL